MQAPEGNRPERQMVYADFRYIRRSPEGAPPNEGTELLALTFGLERKISCCCIVAGSWNAAPAVWSVCTRSCEISQGCTADCRSHTVAPKTSCDIAAV